MSQSKEPEFLGISPLEVGCHSAPGSFQAVLSSTRASQTTRKSILGWTILKNLMILLNFPVQNTHEVWNLLHSSHIRGNYVNLDFIYLFLFWITNISRFLQNKTFQNTHWETWVLYPCPSTLSQRLMGNRFGFPTTYFFIFLSFYFENF